MESSENAVLQALEKFGAQLADVKAELAGVKSDVAGLSSTIAAVGAGLAGETSELGTMKGQLDSYQQRLNQMEIQADARERALNDKVEELTFSNLLDKQVRQGAYQSQFAPVGGENSGDDNRFVHASSEDTFYPQGKRARHRDARNYNPLDQH